MTVEHLLLAIVDTPEVREILRACGADVARLRKDLKDFIDQTTPRLKDDDDREVQPTLGFQRDLQREALACGLPAVDAGRRASRCRQLHLPRPVEGRGPRSLREVR